MHDTLKAVFSPKDPREIIALTFDFGVFASTGFSSPILTIERLGGVADPTPENMLVGPPLVVGSTVTHHFAGGVDGTNYLITCQVTNDSNVYVIAGELEVRKAMGRYNQSEVQE